MGTTNVQIIPTATNGDAAPFDQRVVLDGRPFTLRFTWIDRMACWVLSIGDDAGTLLIGNLPIRNDTAMLFPYKSDARLPQGEFWASAETAPDVDAVRGDLGKRVILHYIKAWQ